MLEDRYKINPESIQRAKQEVQRLDALIEAAGGIVRYMAGPVYRSTDKKKGDHVYYGECQSLFESVPPGTPDRSDTRQVNRSNERHEQHTGGEGRYS